MAKQGFLNRIIMGSENMPDFTPNKLPHSRWGLWWDIIKNRMGTLMKINLLFLLFLIPVVLVLVITALQKGIYTSIIPSTGNFGIGYPVVDNAQSLYNTMNMSVNISEYLMLLPCFMLVSIGLAGACYTMRRLVWGEGVMVGSNFKEGIKTNWKMFVGLSILVGMSFFAMMFCFFGLDFYGIGGFICSALRVVGVIQFIFTLILLMYFCTQCVTYKLGFLSLIKNSFIFALAYLPQNLFFFGISAIPVLIVIFLSSNVIFAIMGWVIFLFIGLSNMVLIWTVFNHYVYDECINDHVKGAKKNRNMYVKTKEDEVKEEIEYVRGRNTVYGMAYASKKLSSIDKGQTFTPLGATYNRNDLFKMKEEKEIMQREVEQEKETIEREILQKEEEIKRQEEAQKKTKKDKKKK